MTEREKEDQEQLEYLKRWQEKQREKKLQKKGKRRWMKKSKRTNL